MANEPLRRTPPRPVAPPADRPEIWATGEQRPPFKLRAFGRASLFLTREAMAPLLAWAARTGRRVATNVRDGAGRIPEQKLGRFARFVPSHLRVAAWIKNLAGTLAHASANADPDVARGNALVQEIEPHLWPLTDAAPPPMPEAPLPGDVAEAQPQAVVLPEPMEAEDDPLASIRGEIDGAPPPPKVRFRGRADPIADGPIGPPAPPGPTAVMAIQIVGYLIGWGSTIIALPYGAVRALWLYAGGRDLRLIGQED
jgi:hypothetical protein